MTPTPDWLTARNAELSPSSAWHGVFVCFEKEPQYELTPLPVKGKFGCRIIQTINGKPIACQDVFPTTDDALRGGLVTLRQYLGW